MRSRTITGIVLSIALAGWTRPAAAYSTYYSSDCSACHGLTVYTCNGCHSHGTHSSSAKSDINVAGSLDRTVYAPGATITVTVNGGYRTGWARVVLLDQAMHELARSSCPGGQGGCSTSVYPVTITAPAPASAGTYTWAVAWYGNAQYEASGASFGGGTSSTLRSGYFTPDASNPNHGYQVVALPAFTVSAAAPPAAAVSPASLAFSNVAVGTSASRTLTLSNTGGATLTGSVALGAGTSAEFTVSPASVSIAPGGSQAITATYAPRDTTSDTGSVVVTTNDPVHPTVSVALSGTGTGTPAPSAALSPASLDFGTVVLGASRSLTATIENTGASPLTVSSVAPCASSTTSSAFTWSSPASPLVIAAGQSAAVQVSFAPAAAGGATGCLAVTSDDPQHPVIDLALSGTAVQASNTPGGSGGGCSTGSSGSAIAALLAIAWLARVAPRRRRATPARR